MLRSRMFLGKLFLFTVVSALAGVLVTALALPFAAAGASAAGFSNRLLSSFPDELEIGRQAQASTVLASDGSLITTFFSQNRDSVPLDSMAQSMQDAIIAIEDARFYDHGGTDPVGILRALAATAGGARQGASTITQQYVNNVIIQSHITAGHPDDVRLGPEKTLRDKLREMKLAVSLEKTHTKDQILQGYLNIIYFGNNAYGIEAAAKYYFGVHAKDLNLHQAATLAGIINNPSFYDPVTQPNHALARRNLVLDKMLEQGRITAAAHSKSVESPIGLDLHPTRQGCVAARTAPYFCDYVQRLILNNPAYGADENARRALLYSGGLTIRTTLDPALQQKAQALVRATMSAGDPLQRGTALVSIQPGTGKVLAMAQNTHYDPAPAPGNYMGNFALPANDKNGNSLNGAGGFQVGSTIKPFIFAQWLNAGKSMNTILNGAARKYPRGYPWKNSCGTTSGAYDPAAGTHLLPNDDPNHYYKMTVLQGLYQSINTITFQSASQLDLCNVQKMTTAAGIRNGHTNAPYDFSKISNLIGSVDVAPLTMANAYATFASGGNYCRPTALTGITDSRGNQLPVPSADCHQTIKPAVAAGVTYALKNVLIKGSGYKLPVDKTSYDIFAKTGTTDGNINTWTVGATAGVATASWFGSYKGTGPQWINQDITINGRYYSVVNGADLAGMQWARFMNQAAPKFSTDNFPPPPASMLRTPQKQSPNNSRDNTAYGTRTDGTRSTTRPSAGR
ncbi:transglycosylase domain-containing protein [Pseudarthrobacter sp. NIBRBAC000502771]|uniref:transglycosylase domain-containing protein n=1 Tax=Pseudarthrobacter sp. NIBRBAC000502771 TaxID=2590774 RepID=UPI001FF00609|nr:transglycosylase domain-containing protein [Pseudarthrobacter sp. NIBRBAC000502771]